MCKETDVEANQRQEEDKEVLPKGLPEPGKPTSIPNDVVIPPTHPKRINKIEKTIAYEDVFADKDLSSISTE